MELVSNSYLVKGSSRSLAYFIHATVWTLLILFPVSLSGTGNVNLAQVVLHGLLGAVIVYSTVVYRLRSEIVLPEQRFTRYFAFLFFVLSYFATLTSLNASAGTINDLLDVFRPVVYFMYFLFPFLVPLSATQTEQLAKYIVWLAVVTVAISALVYVAPMWPVVDWWKGRTSSDPIIFHFYRWSGTSGYPSDYAFFLSFFVYGLLLKRGDLFGKWLDILLVGVFSLAVAMTLSRGGIASIIFMTFVGGLMYRRVRSLVVVGIAVLICALFLSYLASLFDTSLFNLNYVWGLLDSGMGADASARYRVRELDLAIEYAVTNFPFGAGAARDVISKNLPIVESLYGHYLIKWGVFGLLSYFLLTIVIVRATIDVDRLIRSNWMSFFCRGALLLFLSVPLIFGFSSAISDRFKGLPFFFLLAGYVAMLATRQRSCNEVVEQKAADVSVGGDSGKSLSSV